MTQPTCIRPRALSFSPAWGGWQMFAQDEDGSPHPTILFDIDETPENDNRKRQKVSSPTDATVSGNKIVSNAHWPSDPFSHVRRPSGDSIASEINPFSHVRRPSGDSIASEDVVMSET